MIESYFFIPGNHQKLKEKINTVKADFIIVDLEDSVKEDSIEVALKEVEKIKNSEIFIRPPVFIGNEYKEEVLIRLLSLGFRKFVIPKLRTQKDLNKLENTIGEDLLLETEIILLIENAECLLFIKEILINTKLNIQAIGFGSQDFCTETGIEHANDLLMFPRSLISLTAKAFNIKSIDIASMNINDSESFKEEIKDSKRMGYDGKFLIHPIQLEILKKIKFYTANEIQYARKILNQYEELGEPAVFVYDNQVIEPPHIKMFRKILKEDV